jgi:MSV199 domain/Protein of unknown function (DUF3627)
MCDKITTFMGCGETVTDARVTTALAHSFIKLSIQEFIEVSGFKIDTMMLNYFWQVMTKRQWVHMHPLVLEFLGYDGSIIDQRKNFIRYLKRQDYKFEELSSIDERCKEYDDIVRDQATMKPAHLAKRKWLIMDSCDFKRAIMGLRTKRADAIKDYYFNLEELVQLYVDYDKRFEVRKFEMESKTLKEEKSRLEQMMEDMKKDIHDVRKQNTELLDINYDQLTKLNDITAQNNDLQDDVTAIGRQLHVACLDRAPRPLQRIHQERFILIKWANLTYHRRVADARPEDNHSIFRYYAIRAQLQSARNSLRAQRQKDPALQIILEIDVQPNTKTLYNRIRDEMAEENGVRFIRNNISILGTEISEQDLVARMMEVNDSKFAIV